MSVSAQFLSGTTDFRVDRDLEQLSPDKQPRHILMVDVENVFNGSLHRHTDCGATSAFVGMTVMGCRTVLFVDDGPPGMQLSLTLWSAQA
ncbi:hypothetical protein M2432_002712 [Mycobacterium sp. OTB74]|nr:hypothetical protein [Mycobacterium sp. OTB74]